jgi:large repetitive protein
VATAAGLVGPQANFVLTNDGGPSITSPNNTTFTVGTPGTFTVTATGTPAPTFSETGALPTGVTFTAATGVLAGTPAAGTAGSYPITFKAHNGIGADASQNFTLTVSPTPVSPSITSANNTTFTVG